ncbi:MAG: hypothetical protein ACYCOU_00235 [Sulfobacillus sp.]
MSAVGTAGTFADMLEVARPADYLFFWNKQPISYLIEELTFGPSHVIQLATLKPSMQMYEFEAVFPTGCRVLPLSHYANSKSRMLLCRRKGITEADVSIATASALRTLGRGYNWPEEIRIALHDILPFIPMGASTNTLYCSGYVQMNFAGTSVHFAAMPNENDTPEFLMKDAGTEYVMWVN